MTIKRLIFLITFSLTFTQSAFARINVSCSMFPVYDFARAVAGNYADITLLLKPGTEPHEFEPSPLDIKALNGADVFIFTGKFMEEWAERISGTLTNTLIINASEGIDIINNDPHIWLDLLTVQRMIRNICEGLSSVDPDNAENYSRNAEEYCSRFSELDAKFAALPKDKTLVFAGEFSCGYFVKRYGFDYVSAYDGENEPSIKRMAEILKHIRENHTRYILSDMPITQITRSISEQTGTEILTFSTAHIIQDTSQTFLEIMTDNFANTAKVLND